MRERPNLPGLPKEKLSREQRAGGTTLESLKQAEARMEEERWKAKIAEAHAGTEEGEIILDKGDIIEEGNQENEPN